MDNDKTLNINLSPPSSEDRTNTYPFEPPSAAHEPSKKLPIKEEAEDSSKGRHDFSLFENVERTSFVERICQDEQNYQARMASVDGDISWIDEDTVLGSSGSPRITVTMWKGDDTLSDDTQSVGRAGSKSQYEYNPTQDSTRPGRLPQSNANTGGFSTWRDKSPIREGLAPNQRPNTTVPSPNQQALQRETEDKNRIVADWICSNAKDDDIDPTQNSSFGRESPGLVETSGIELTEVALGDNTANKRIPEQLYYKTDGGDLTRTDKELILTNRNWGDPPMLQDIITTRYQPEASQAAIERFYQQCQGNASIVSRAATWGTRRRSLSSDSITRDSISGNILTKLSVDSSSRSPTLLQRVSSIFKRGGLSSKRKGGEMDKSISWEEPDKSTADWGERHESADTLVPPSRTSSWGLGSIRSKPIPSIKTALIGVSNDAASIGTQGFRHGSIGLASQKDPSASLRVPDMGKTSGKQQSQNDVLKQHNENIPSKTLAAMLTKQGGLPEAMLARDQAILSDVSDDDGDYSKIHTLSIGPQKLLDLSPDSSYEPDSGYDSIYSPADASRNIEIIALPNDYYTTNYQDEPLWGTVGLSRAAGQKVEANECCEICGFRPKGDPQWFKSSLAKHKKIKHPTNTPAIFKYPSFQNTEPTSEPQLLSPQKEESKTDVEMAESPTIQVSKPLPHSQHVPIHLPQYNRIVQVGRAKIRVEELALYEYTEKDLGTPSHSDDSSDSTDEEHSLDDSGSCQDVENSNARHSGTCGNTNTSSRSTPSNTSSGKPTGQKDQRNEGNDGRRRDKRRRDSRGPSDQKCQRLACPYQAYEKFQPCFRAGPRNPGGCNGLSRLKQHLHRRHNLAYRCKRCWQSFDSTVKLNEHESQEEPCTIRTKPEYERFMTEDEVIEVGMISFSGSQCRVWWKLFQLLVPDMQNRQIASLELSYSPYYVSSYMIPAVSVSFPNMIFQPMQAATRPEAMSDIRAPASNSSIDISMLDTEQGDADPSAIFAVPSSGVQTMSLPLFEAFNFDGEPPSDPARVFTPPDSDFNPSVSMPSILGSPWPASSFSSPPSVGTPSQLVMGTSVPPEQQSQWRRNYDRLKSRSQLTENELSDMRESNRESRADLDRVDAILEDVLGLESLPAHIYDRLIQASEIISTTRKKLR
ncbi:hypothetical protein F5Y08DRAFT_274937 [Xylaria arbuscula]|nr:hypothetical protein F5Y08DRAFT_274937 [Xylaria arbuscula]